MMKGSEDRNDERQSGLTTQERRPIRELFKKRVCDDTPVSRRDSRQTLRKLLRDEIPEGRGRLLISLLMLRSH